MTDGRKKFGTYFKDAGSNGMYYADQRYCAVGNGRVMTPDPSGVDAVDATNPNSWNMYSYAGGDPIKFYDPDGLATSSCSNSWFSYNGQVIGTVGDALKLTKDVTILAEGATMSWWSRSLICVIAGLLSAPACTSASIEDVARSEAAEAIRWVAFWEGPRALGGNYKPGSNVDLSVIRTPARLYAILGPLHLLVNIAVQGAEYRVQTVEIVRPPGTTNSDAAEWFFRMQGPAGMAGCINTSNQPLNPKAGSTLPISRPCPAAPGGVLSENTLSFTLPSLTPPDAIQKKTIPSDKDALLMAVRQYVESRIRICGPLRAKIPFYADTDPRVYVLLPHAGNCPSGVATFSRTTDSTWEFGKFIADVPKEELSGVVAKIESNTAVTIP